MQKTDNRWFDFAHSASRKTVRIERQLRADSDKVDEDFHTVARQLQRFLQFRDTKQIDDVLARLIIWMC